MKQLILTTAVALLLSANTFASNKTLKVTGEPKANQQITIENSATKASFPPGVWNEEKMGTYRGSFLGSLFFGRCKTSTDLCMIIFHEGDAPWVTARFNDAAQTEIDAKAYSSYPYYDSVLDENGTEYAFEIYVH